MNVKAILVVGLMAVLADFGLFFPAAGTGAEGLTSFRGSQAGPTVYSVNSTGTAIEGLSNGVAPGVRAHSVNGVGVYGSSRGSIGIEGDSLLSVGVKGVSYSSFGVVGVTHVGASYLAGVYGVDVSPTPGPTASPNAGVTGYSMNGFGTISQTSFGPTAVLAIAGGNVLAGTSLPPRGHAVAVYGENDDPQYAPAQFVQRNGSGPLLLIVNTTTGGYAEVDANGNLHISGQVYVGGAPLLLRKNRVRR